ncbi:YveK family protein [Gordonia sp. NPDC003504]
MRSPSDRHPADYASLWVRGLPVVALSMIGAVLAGLVAFALLPRTYESQARLLITAPGPASVTAAQASDLAGRLRLSSYEELATSDQVLGRTRLEDGAGALSGTDIATLRERITVVPSVDDAVLIINVTGPTADAAGTLARGVSTNLAAVVNEVEWSGADGAAQYSVEVIDAGSTPESASSPRIWTTLLTALGLGVLLSSVAVIAVGLRRDLVDGPRDALVRVRDVHAGVGS